MDEDFYRARALQVRDIAEKADPFTKQRLLKLADQYEVWAGNPSRASRSLARPIPLPFTQTRGKA
ncbi:hypothetical protein NLM33_38495 [Bradyrhizobium sp. CCGUVB1N3]|uniref:hypothetical protein n=1 Tax=Bradyrhizobium sp. CCGUVB1N3 TaxID=2949629 RepID=UPI0020B443B8|nr:hypothetical protein [Bradyrhizobium sp. CCGUVB1N3]MCP3476121.1 hypothetical protein [Bradyrhizobium sp. CCGUVB1N3]